MSVSPPARIDPDANRAARKYSKNELVLRVLWGLAQPLFRFSPRTFFAWRSFLLRCFGAKLGKHVHIYPSVRIFLPSHLEMGDHASIGEWALIYNLGHVRIGDRAAVSHGSHVCAGTHDYQKATMPLLKPPINIEADAWICADAFIGPGVTVGKAAVVAARAVVVKDVEPGDVVGGNPARFIKKRELEGPGS